MIVWTLLQTQAQRLIHQPNPILLQLLTFTAPYEPDLSLQVPCSKPRLYLQFNFQMRSTIHMSRTNQRYHFSRLSLLCVQLFCLVHASDAKEACYRPDGSLAEEYFACYEGNSPCCHDGEICLSNNFCYVGSFGKVSTPGLSDTAGFSYNLLDLSWGLYTSRLGQQRMPQSILQ